MINISISANETTQKEWDNYVENHPNFSVFHQFGWSKVLTESFNFECHYIAAKNKNKIIGILPLAEVRTLLFGHTLVSLPFCHYAGPLSDDEQISAELIKFAENLAIEKRVDYLEIRSLQQPKTTWPKLSETYVTFRQEIPDTPEKILAKIPRKQRAMVRKGEAAGLIAENGTVDEFHDIYSKSVHRLGSPTYSKSYLKSLITSFPHPDNIIIIKSKEKQPISAVLTLFTYNEAFPIYAGDLPEARMLAANDFKYAELHRRALSTNIKNFNFGRSKIGTGSFDFKKNWGYNPTELHYEYKLLTRKTIPQNNPNNPKYKLLIRGWKSAPLRVVNLLSPFIIKGLG